MVGDDRLSKTGPQIDISCLERLIALGLSDADIEVGFSLSDGQVRILREQHNLRAASTDGRLDALLDLVAGPTLDELTNAVQAAVSYANSAIKCARRDGAVTEVCIMLMEKSLEQTLRIGKAYRSLQTLTKPAAE